MSTYRIIEPHQIEFHHDISTFDGNFFFFFFWGSMSRYVISTPKNLVRRLTTSTASPLSLPAVQKKLKYLISEELYDETVELYREELRHCCDYHANPYILPSVIKACSNSQVHHRLGFQLHCVALKSSSHSDPVVSNSLISMYAKFSETGSAFKVFDEMSDRDIVSWNSIVNCFAQNGCLLESVEMLKRMYLCRFVPKPELIAAVISLCAKAGCLRVGRQIHALVIADEMIEASVYVLTSLLDLYSKHQDCLMALRVFDQMEVRNEVSWTAMISACFADHRYGMGFAYFQAMQRDGVKPNRVASIAVLLACAELDCVLYGKAIHGYAYRHGFDSDNHFSASLMHMYCECKEARISAARIIFERSKVKDVVMWSSIIRSYMQRGNFGEAMELLRKMRLEGFQPNSVTLLPIISACSDLSSLVHGFGIHCYALKTGLHSHFYVGNTLINMYAKCGYMTGSRQIFEEMGVRDLVTWSTLISCYGLHSRGEEALRLFNEMQKMGIEPDSTALLAVLSACNHCGLVDEGKTLFTTFVLRDEKNESLRMELYACYVDLLGKNGEIEEACEVVSRMGMNPGGAKILSSLVSACKLHGRIEVAEKLAHRLIELEPGNAANYTLLSMVYAESGNWFAVEKVRRVMKKLGLAKFHGFSRTQ